MKIPEQVKTCISCLEICLSDENKPRCFECLQDNIPALDLKKCFCGKIYPWVKIDGITRNGNICEDCTKQRKNNKKHDSNSWKRKRCMSCTNFTVSKLSKFCLKCDPRLTLKSKEKRILIEKDDRNKTPVNQEPLIVSKISQPTKEDNGISLKVQGIKILPQNNQNIIHPSVQKWNCSKLENPNLNICFLNSTIQFIISIEAIADILCYEYIKKYCRRSSFLTESEKIEMLQNPNQAISLANLAKKIFLNEFETLTINMLKNPKESFSAAKLANKLEQLELGYVYGQQWDCSSVVDLFFTLYQQFIDAENFNGKSNAQVALNSLKITVSISTQCKKCNRIKIKETTENHLFVPLRNDIDNIFYPYYSDCNDYSCEICNVLAGNPHPHVITGAIQKTEIKSISKYVNIKFGRVKLNGEKITYKVTVPESNFILDKNLKLEAWVEHIGETIYSGHYYLIRRTGQACIKISDDCLSNYDNTSILSSKLCYIALLKTY